MRDGHAKVPLGEVHPEAARLEPEAKRICDAISISAYDAETTLARMLRPHFARAKDEARTLAQEICAAPAGIEVVGKRLEVRIEPLSDPRRTRALAAPVVGQGGAHVSRLGWDDLHGSKGVGERPAQPASKPRGSRSEVQPRRATAWTQANRSVMPAT